MSTDPAGVSVSPNKPRLLDPGTPPPAPEVTAAGEVDQAQQIAAPPERYWTTERTGYMYAQLCRAGAMATDTPGLRASRDEIEMLAEPASAVLNDWAPLTIGDQGNKMANLITLAIVLVLVVVIKLPDIMLAVQNVRDKRTPKPPPPQANASVANRPQAPQGSPSNVVEIPAAQRLDPVADSWKDRVFAGQAMGGQDLVDA